MSSDDPAEGVVFRSVNSMRIKHMPQTFLTYFLSSMKFSMKLLPLVNVALGATFNRFKSHIVDPIECEDRSASELEINGELDLELIEGDIVPNVNEMNIQTDLSYRWPGAKLYVDVLPEVDYNVVGVLHQVSRYSVSAETVKGLILIPRNRGVHIIYDNIILFHFRPFVS